MTDREVTERKAAVVLSAGEIEDRRKVFSHPWNERSHVDGVHLSGAAGLERSGVSVVVVAPGKESFVYHSHDFEEEWIYILEGRAQMRIDERETLLSAGDFVAFPTPSVAHHLTNPYDEPVRYLMGGECREVEIAHFPDLGRRLIRQGSKVDVIREDAIEDFARLVDEPKEQ